MTIENAPVIDFNATYNVNRIDVIVDEINDLGFDHVSGYPSKNGVNIALTFAIDSIIADGFEPRYTSDYESAMLNQLDYLEEMGVDSVIVNYARVEIYKLDAIFNIIDLIDRDAFERKLNGEN